MLEGAAKGEWKMTVPLPADLEQYVEERVAAGAFASRDALVLEAVRLYREIELRTGVLAEKSTPARVPLLGRCRARP